MRDPAECFGKRHFFILLFAAFQILLLKKAVNRAPFTINV